MQGSGGPLTQTAESRRESQITSTQLITNWTRPSCTPKSRPKWFHGADPEEESWWCAPRMAGRDVRESFVVPLDQHNHVFVTGSRGGRLVFVEEHFSPSFGGFLFFFARKTSGASELLIVIQNYCRLLLCCVPQFPLWREGERVLCKQEMSMLGRSDARRWPGERIGVWGWNRLG